MDWVFIVFAVATFIYSSAIIKEFLFEARVQQSLHQTLLQERVELESKIEEQKLEEQGVRAQIQEVKTAIKELQSVANERQGTIQNFEAELAKQGKYRVIA